MDKAPDYRTRMTQMERVLADSFFKTIRVNLRAILVVFSSISSAPSYATLLNSWTCVLPGLDLVNDILSIQIGFYFDPFDILCDNCIPHQSFSG